MSCMLEPFNLFRTDPTCLPKREPAARREVGDPGPHRRPVRPLRRRSMLECRSQRCLDGNRLDFLAEHCALPANSGLSLDTKPSRTHGLGDL